jgi:hypothetical protein
MNDFEKAIQDCMLLSQEADSSGIEYIIVLKAIPRDTTGMIPNYRIYSSNDVASVFDKFLSQNRNKDNEIWFCQTITARNSGNLGGRLTLNRTHHNEYIEIVWYTSPRRIEDAQSQNFPYPYWRAIRPLGRAQFCTEHLRIPSNYRDHIEDEYISEGKQTLIEIMKYREELDILKSILFALDAKEVTIEFIMEEGNLKFIDWDTDIEYEAIKNSKGRSN